MTELSEEKQKTEDTIELEIESFMAKHSRLILQIAGGSIFGALSAVLSFLAPLLPRTPQGLAFFDPISIIWVMAFVIFGPLAGILASVIGMLTLMPFDSFAPIGPFMKFAATFSLIIVPILFLKLRKKKSGERESQILKRPKVYILYGGLGALLRILVMTILNIIVYLLLFGPTGLEAYLIVAAFVNLLQSLWDLLIPYLVVFGLKLDQSFEVW
ncbi:MAG: conserved membrane protein of unknown function [Promethearchaeota archaeon]|nr:MAG: conserved membrane protein of unknown function [Candidatus Lokiarchaeota archaeon]